MNSGLFKLNWTDVKSALVYGLVVGLLALAAFFLKAGTFFGVDYKSLVDVFGLAFLGAVAGLVVPLLTTNRGNFVGAVNVKDVY